MRSISFVRGAACLGVVALAACDDSSSPNTRPVQVSFSTQAAAAAQGDNNVALDVTVTLGAHTLVITKAQVVVRKLQLEQNLSTTCPDDDDSPSGDDCSEIKLGPMLVDLPLTATASSSITAAVPEGTYHKVKFQIHKPSGSNDQAFLAANPAFANTSIRVEGTYDGSPFVFTSPMSEEIELEFEPPVVIDANNQNVTVAVDLSNWFMVNGALVDPTTANNGGANENAVRNNIRASLRAFEDEDRDGDEDDS